MDGFFHSKTLSRQPQGLDASFILSLGHRREGKPSEYSFSCHFLNWTWSKSPQLWKVLPSHLCRWSLVREFLLLHPGCERRAGCARLSMDTGPTFLCPLVTEPGVPELWWIKLHPELTSQHISLPKLHLFVPPGEDRTSPIHHFHQSREDVAAVPNCCSGNGVGDSATASGVELDKNQPLPCPFATCKGSSLKDSFCSQIFAALLF